jgi:hypothetical protein
MTIATTHFRKDLVGNGATDTFAFDFPILAAADLLVTVAGVLKTLGVHYNITGTLPGTGSVVFTGGNIPADQAAVVLIRSTPRTQSLDLISGGQFYEANLESAFDKLTMIAQELTP